MALVQVWITGSGGWLISRNIIKRKGSTVGWGCWKDIFL